MPKHWQKLCYLIGRPDLVEDRRFAEQRSRSINYAELTAELGGTGQQTATEWVQLLQANGLISLPRHTWKQVVDTPLFAERPHPLEVGRGADTITIRTGALRQLPRGVTDPRPPPAN